MPPSGGAPLGEHPLSAVNFFCSCVNTSSGPKIFLILPNTESHCRVLMSGFELGEGEGRIW